MYKELKKSGVYGVGSTSERKVVIHLCQRGKRFRDITIKRNYIIQS